MQELAGFKVKPHLSVGRVVGVYGLSEIESEIESVDDHRREEKIDHTEQK